MCVCPHRVVDDGVLFFTFHYVQIQFYSQDLHLWSRSLSVCCYYNILLPIFFIESKMWNWNSSYPHTFRLAKQVNITSLIMDRTGSILQLLLSLRTPSRSDSFEIASKYIGKNFMVCPPRPTSTRKRVIALCFFKNTEIKQSN